MAGAFLLAGKALNVGERGLPWRGRQVRRVALGAYRVVFRRSDVTLDTLDGSFALKAVRQSEAMLRALHFDVYCPPLVGMVAAEWTRRQGGGGVGSVPELCPPYRPLGLAAATQG